MPLHQVTAKAGALTTGYEPRFQQDAIEVSAE